MLLLVSMARPCSGSSRSLLNGHNKSSTTATFRLLVAYRMEFLRAPCLGLSFFYYTQQNYLTTPVYKCLHGFSPPYLAEDYVLVASLSGRQHLRSADTCKLFVPKTSMNYGSRSFTVHGPNSWNSLPAELRLTDTLTTFRRKLKTHVFSL